MRRRRESARREGRQPCNLSSDDERLNRAGAFVGEDRFNIGVMAGDMILQQNTVAAQHLTRLGDNLAREPGIVHLRQRSHSRRHPALRLEMAQAQA